jgi:hypothetical protein
MYQTGGNVLCVMNTYATQHSRIAQVARRFLSDVDYVDRWLTHDR